MSNTRYRESRILARSIHRLPNEDHTKYNHKVSELRKHFENFSVNVSEICQWLMGLRPGGKRENDKVWNLLLEPSDVFKGQDEKQVDRYRRLVFGDRCKMQ